MVTVLRSHERRSEKLNALHRFHVDQTLTPVRAREAWGYFVHGNHVIIGTTLLENRYGVGILKFGFLQSIHAMWLLSFAGCLSIAIRLHLHCWTESMEGIATR